MGNLGGARGSGSMRKNVNDWTYTGAMNNIYETDCRINEYDARAHGRRCM